jgi:hypothetical protein
LEKRSVQAFMAFKDIIGTAWLGKPVSGGVIGVYVD